MMPEMTGETVYLQFSFHLKSAKSELENILCFLMLTLPSFQEKELDWCIKILYKHGRITPTKIPFPTTKYHEVHIWLNFTDIKSICRTGA